MDREMSQSAGDQALPDMRKQKADGGEGEKNVLSSLFSGILEQ